MRFDGFEMGEVLALLSQAPRPKRNGPGCLAQTAAFSTARTARRLHVVMAIDDEVAAARGFRARRFGHHDGMAWSGAESSLEANLPQCFTNHSAHAFMSLRCCGCAETLGKRT